MNGFRFHFSLLCVILAICSCSTKPVNPNINRLFLKVAAPAPYTRNAYDTNETLVVDQHVCSLMATNVHCMFTPVQTISNIYTLTPSDGTVLLNGNNLTVKLPDAAIVVGATFILKLISPSTTATITNSTGGQKIDGALSYLISTQYNAVAVQSDGYQWWCLNKFF